MDTLGATVQEQHIIKMILLLFHYQTETSRHIGLKIHIKLKYYTVLDYFFGQIDHEWQSLVTTKIKFLKILILWSLVTVQQAIN